MFIDFFYLLREHRIAVSSTEWLTLMEALDQDLAGSSLSRFYHLCRAICVKSESLFDTYDQCFAHYFKGADVPTGLKDELLAWLENPIDPKKLSPEELAALKSLSIEELRKLFEERLKEQDERHDGGNRWIGTGGTSPFGHGGSHPSGVRVGGSGGGRSAMQIASLRRFRNLRSDVTLDIRQIGVALRQLRRLTRDGRPEELDLDGTIDATAKNYGDLEFIFRPERKNAVKLLLLMDVGGSMTPYTRLCEKLFSAAHKATHFKAFKYYYFHNCVYDELYSDMAQMKGEPSGKILDNLDRTWFCILVGDAAMHPAELSSSGGAIDYFQSNSQPGIWWLNRINERLPRSAWLNPEPEAYWNLPSNLMIQQVFKMFPLTVKGLEESVSHLRRVRI